MSEYCTGQRQQTRDGWFWRRRLSAVTGLLAWVACGCWLVAAEPTAPIKPALEPQWIQARAGHIAFEAFGRDSSLTHVEVMPYLKGEEIMFFGDGRFFATNEGEFGGNFGLGFRYYNSTWDRFFGGSLWYDIDDTTGELFHQVGLSLESRGPIWDIRSNFYLPVGNDQQDYRSYLGNQQFVGNNIRYDSLREFGEAMKGVDFEYGLPLPSEIARAHDLRAYAGAYYFSGDEVSDIVGWKTRLEGNLINNVALQLELTDDGTFGTNITLGVAITLPGGPRETSSQCSSWSRPLPYVQRNYNIIVSRGTDVRAGLTAVNPATDQPYIVQHVSTTASGDPLGSVESPFADIAAAQAAAGDIIFVHAGSVLGDALVLQAGERVLGEGAAHYVDIAGFGRLLLPGASAGVDRPAIVGVASDAVTLASGSEFSGFLVDDAAGYGIVGRGVQDVAVSDVEVRNTGLDGILIENSSGDATLNRIAVSDTTGAGLHIEGGTGSVEFEGETTVAGAGGAGVLIQGTSGDVSFETLSVTAGGAGPGVNIVDSPGSVSFKQLEIAATGATGLQARDSGEVTVSGGTIASSGGSAADIENTAMDISLTSVSSSGATYGLRIVDSGGKFLVYGRGDEGSGGMIQNATTGVMVVNSGSVGFQYLDLKANATGADVRGADYFVLAAARVTDSLNYGIRSTNTKIFELVDSTFENNGGPGGNTVLGLTDAAGSYTYVIHSNTFTDASDAAIALTSSGAGDGSTLLVAIETNEFTSQQAGSAAIAMDHSGIVQASFVDNVFSATGGSNRGIDVNARSPSALLSVAASGNTMDFAGGDDVGFRFNTLGPSSIRLSDNVIDFSAATGTGMDFTLASSANVVLAGNEITDNASGGTGVLFRSIAGPSSVTMNDNTIELLGPTYVVDRGIFFESATGTVTLQSSLNNAVNGASIPFYAPLGTTSGFLRINGDKVP
ncbi:MAG: right-handed parallel beta-helix repeat-containing protein [Rhodopirellula sp.]|nr:right-handed parallel beta-helix repeat-containing protein [Rhodopirellula sp.]